MKCHACKKDLNLTTKIGRRDECPFCRTDLHCCLNCLFFDASAPKQCREPVAEPVREKQKANFCDYFRAFEKNQTPSDEAVKKSRKELDDLFKR